MRPWTASAKCSGRRKSATREWAALLTRMAPRSACSASILAGGVRYCGPSLSRSGVIVAVGAASIALNLSVRGSARHAQKLQHPVEQWDGSAVTPEQHQGGAKR